MQFPETELTNRNENNRLSAGVQGSEGVVITFSKAKVALTTMQVHKSVLLQGVHSSKRCTLQYPASGPGDTMRTWGNKQWKQCPHFHVESRKSNEQTQCLMSQTIPSTVVWAIAQFNIVFVLIHCLIYICGGSLVRDRK